MSTSRLTEHSTQVTQYNNMDSAQFNFTVLQVKRTSFIQQLPSSYSK